MACRGILRGTARMATCRERTLRQPVAAAVVEVREAALHNRALELAALRVDDRRTAGADRAKAADDDAVDDGDRRHAGGRNGDGPGADLGIADLHDAAARRFDGDAGRVDDDAVELHRPQARALDRLGLAQVPARRRRRAAARAARRRRRGRRARAPGGAGRRDVDDRVADLDALTSAALVDGNRPAADLDRLAARPLLHDDVRPADADARRLGRLPQD